jgi:NDP-sugar pyrophosphorylase family protein
MSLPVAILCGGLATRLGDLTKATPKSILIVAGEPFIAHQLRLLAKHRVREVVLLCGHLGEQIQAYVGDGHTFGLHVRYVFDGEKLLGTGGAVKQALPLLGDDFMLLYGDSYLPVDYQAIAAFYHQHACRALMTVFRNAGSWDESNVVFEQGRIVRYDKKPQERVPGLRYDYIDYGLGIIHSALLESYSGAFDIAAFYRAQVDAQALCGYEVATRFYEIGSQAGLRDTETYIKAQAHGE